MAAEARSSVVVVHWNTPDLLLRCLEGLRQAREDGSAEVLVIDNGSAEGGFPDIAEAAGLRIVRNPGNHGFARAANQGALWARGEFLLLLNADAVVSGPELASLEAALDADPGLAAVAPCLLGPDGKAVSPAMRYLTPFNHAAGLLGFGAGRHRQAAEGQGVRDADWVQASVLLLRASAFSALCGFDEAYFFYGEDEDLCWRLGRRGYRVAVHNGVHVRDEGGASTRQMPAWAEAQLYSGHLRFIRRRGGGLALLLYRLAVTVALLVKLVSGRRGRGRPGAGPMVALKSVWGRRTLSTVRG